MTQPPEAGDLRSAVAICGYLADTMDTAAAISERPEEQRVWSVRANAIRTILAAKPSDLEPSDLRSSPAPSQGDVELRVARAMCVADGFDPDGLIAYAEAGRREALDEWDSYRRRARAAIAAMPVSAGYREGLEAAAKLAQRFNLGEVRDERDSARNATAQLIATDIRALSDDDGKEGR